MNASWVSGVVASLAITSVTLEIEKLVQRGRDGD